MTVAQKKAFERFVLDGEYGPEGLTPEEQAGVAEAAYQFVQYQYVAKNIDLKDYRRHEGERRRSARQRTKGSQ